LSPRYIMTYLWSLTYLIFCILYSHMYCAAMTHVYGCETAGVDIRLDTQVQ
jgi:hypothetical protein